MPADGQWHSKALLQDKKHAKSYTLVLDLRAVEPDQLRMDVTNPIGVYLATLVLNGRQIDYMAVRERKFFTGPADAKIMQELIQIPIDPHDLIKVLFHKPLGTTWRCEGTLAQPSSCDHAETATRMIWKERTETSESIEIASTGITIFLKLEAIGAKVEISDKTFKLIPPSGYQITRLRDSNSMQ